MAKVTLNLSQLFIFNIVILSVTSYAIDSISDSIPLCGSLDGSLSSKDNQRIHFKDKDQGIRTVEMNGTIIGCYADPLTGASSSSNQSFTPDVSKCAVDDQTYCIKDDSYPIDYVQYLLQRHWHMLSYVFGSDMKYLYGDIIDPVVIDVETDICGYHEKIIYPTTGVRVDGTELYIINTPEHKQGIDVSICEHKFNPCHMTKSFPADVRTECQQRYVYRELLALSPQGVPIKDKFKFPAFCMCTIITQQ